MPRKFRFTSTSRLARRPVTIGVSGGTTSIANPHTLTGISPSSGSSDGGTTLTLTGTNFIAGATVTVGGTSATSVSVVSSVSITCVSPAHSAGVVDVTVTIAGVNATITSGYTYTAPAIVFHADWSTATGVTQSALLDSSKTLPFDNAADFGGQEVMRVVTAASAGISVPVGMANLLRIRRNNVNSGGFCKIGTNASASATSPKWAALGVGESWFARVYTYCAVPDSEGKTPIPGAGGLSHHPWQQPHDIGHIEILTDYPYNDGTMNCEFYTGAGSSSAPRDKAQLGPYIGGADVIGARLPKATLLRREMMWRRDTSTTFSCYIRIYDATNESSGGNGVLLWSEDGVGASQGTVCQQGQGSASMKAGDGAYGTVAPNTILDDLRSIAIGENGGYFGYSQDVFWYIGGVAIAQGPTASTTWINKYSGGI